MTSNHRPQTGAIAALRRRTILPGLLAVSAFAVTALPAHGESGGRSPVPAKRTYFVTIVGLGDGPFDQQADCIRFKRKRFCTLDGAVCGRWTPRDEEGQTPRRTVFDFDVEVFNDEGLPVQVDGCGTAEDRGPRSAIGAVGRATVQEESINFSFSGREARTQRCLELVAEWEARQGAG